MSRREKNDVQEKEAPKEYTINKKGLFWMVVGLIAIIAIIIFIVLIVAKIQNNLEIGSVRAERILETMEFSGYLPWNVEEDRLRAVLVCPDGKLFVHSGIGYGVELLECQYYLAQGVEVNYSGKILTPDAKIYFDKISNE